MPIVFLSPSTQDWNPYVTGSGSEEYWMNQIADAMEPYLRSNGIRFRRNDPDTSAAAAIREANSGYYDFYLALHSNAIGNGEPQTTARGIIAFYYPGSTGGQRGAELIAENLREIYIEAYTQKEACEYIQRETAKELYQIFGSYQPDLTERDFYELEIGSAGIMRGYMAHPCDAELTLEKKLRLFFTMSLRAYNVPEEEIGRVIRFVEGLDIRAISEQVMQKLFKALAMHYEFSLQGIM